MTDGFVWKGLTDVRTRVERIAGHDEVKILLTGETGTGKSKIAKIIHELSARKDRPFKRQNCAGLQDALLESEIFGHGKGAFTGAKEDKDGLVAVADGGTLFLDEVQALAPNLQDKLLIFLEAGHYRRVGETRDRVSNVRIICATSANLQAVATFSKPFFHRIANYQITIPALRDRKEAVPAIARQVLNLLHARDGHVPVELNDDALEVLLSSDFPGNIRELENLLTTAGIDHQEGDFITRADLVKAGLQLGRTTSLLVKITESNPAPLSSHEDYEIVARTAESLEGFREHTDRHSAFGPAVIHGALVLLDDLRHTKASGAAGSLLNGLTVRRDSPGFLLVAYALSVAIRVDLSKSDDASEAGTLADYSSSFGKGKHMGEFLLMVRRLVEHDF